MGRVGGSGRKWRELGEWEEVEGVGEVGGVCGSGKGAAVAQDSQKLAQSELTSFSAQSSAVQLKFKDKNRQQNSSDGFS